jgi:hypothetical protein
MKVFIDPSISRVLPDFTVIAMTMDIKLADSSVIKDLVAQYEKQIREEYSLSDILNIPLIKEGRDGYKLKPILQKRLDNQGWRRGKLLDCFVPDGILRITVWTKW